MTMTKADANEIARIIGALTMCLSWMPPGAGRLELQREIEAIEGLARSADMVAE